MSYDLYIADPLFSSWSMRGWLMFTQFGIPHTAHDCGLYRGTLKEDLADLSFAKTVPAVRGDDGVILSDSVAIAETLAEAYPERGLYPTLPAHKALARSIVGETHSNFAALFKECPMDLRQVWEGFELSAAAQMALDRVVLLWQAALSHPVKAEGDGPWLFGRYTLADVFSAPIAARIVTYNLDVPSEIRDYAMAHLNDLAFRRWRAMGLIKTYETPPYPSDLPQKPWPVNVKAARVVSDGPSVNAVCPYSGFPPEYYMEYEGRVYGFCNAGCRDKTALDPMAWPKFAALLQSGKT